MTKTSTLPKQNRIALVAHDGRKQDLLTWVEYNKGTLSRHFLMGTGTTGKLISDETGPLDPVAGHIPGAVNRYYKDNLGEDGKMKPVSELKQIFSDLIGETQPENVIFYCGSGVTSAHNILAMAHAGLGMARIYPGSWSEWIINPDHLIKTAND